tara:strand:+ start:120 stop:1139 length:1020 start_codon:yes stop_codon:yes gene_type:complete
MAIYFQILSSPSNLHQAHLHYGAIPCPFLIPASSISSCTYATQKGLSASSVRADTSYDTDSSKNTSTNYFEHLGNDLKEMIVQTFQNLTWKEFLKILNTSPAMKSLIMNVLSSKTKIIESENTYFPNKEELRSFIICLKYCTKLSVLSINSSLFKENEAEKLGSSLKKSVTLCKLNLFRVSIGAEGVRKLVEGLEQCPSLIYLNLSDTKMGNQGAGFLAEALGQFPSLVCLSLMHNEIGDEGVMKLEPALLKTPQLEELLLDFNNITEKSSKKLSNVPEQCTELWNLSLSSNLIDESALHDFEAKISQYKSLVELNLSLQKQSDEMKGCKEIGNLTIFL